MDMNDVELRLIKLHDDLHKKYRQSNTLFFSNTLMRLAMKDIGAEIRAILADIRAKEDK